MPKYSVSLESSVTERKLSQLLTALKSLGTISVFEVEKINPADTSAHDTLPEIQDGPDVKVFPLCEVMEKIYEKYPRKQGKAKGMERLVLYLKKGCELAGAKKITLNHHQIFLAVQQYALECDELCKEQRYIKEFSTFMNKSVIDYVEVTTDIYEKGMRSVYGEDWRKLKFEYK